MGSRSRLYDPLSSPSTLPVPDTRYTSPVSLVLVGSPSVTVYPLSCLDRTHKCVTEKDRHTGTRSRSGETRNRRIGDYTPMSVNRVRRMLVRHEGRTTMEGDYHPIVVHSPHPTPVLPARWIPGSTFSLCCTENDRRGNPSSVPAYRE